MKKYLFVLVGVGAMATLASCSSDEPGIPSGDGSVSFRITIPDAGSRAYGDVPECDRLTFTVYDDKGNEIIPDSTVNVFGNGVKTAQVNLKLVKNENYRIVFFAFNHDSHFATYEKGLMTVHYDQLTVNDEKHDAFFRSYPFTAKGEEVDVILYRPFAQVNIGTDDLDEQAITKIIDNIRTNLTITDGLYTQMNLKDSTLVETSAVTEALSFPTTDAPAVNNDFPLPEYSNLTSIYLLVPTDRSTIKGSYAMTNGANTINELNLDNTPVRLNHRTNIFGTLLTTDQPFNVIIEPAFFNPTYNMGWEGETEINLDDGDKMILGANITEGLTVSGSGTLTINGSTIAPTAEGTPAITLADGANVKMVITDSRLKGAMNGEAIKVPATAAITLSGKNITLTGNNGMEYFANYPQYSNTTNAAYTNSGASALGNTDETVGSITIENATNLTAAAYGRHAYGIGGPEANITISNSTISYARGGYAQPRLIIDLSYGKAEPEGGAAIGSWKEGSVTMTSSTVNKADGGSKAAAIGGAYWSTTEINITGCTLRNITGGNASAAVGGSRYAGAKDTEADYMPHLVKITITDSDIQCQGGEYGAGIGSGYDTYCIGYPADIVTINISGNSTMAAVGGKYGAGIGTGFHVGSLSGSIAAGVDVSAVKAGTPNAYKADYTYGQNIGYGVCDPARELKDVVPVFTVAGVVISYPEIWP